MKKLLLLLAAVSAIFTACEKVDLSDIYDRLDTVENQLGISHGFNNKIYYTTSDNTKLFPKTDASLYGAILISNTYKDGQGVLTFDDSVTLIGNDAFRDCTSLTSITIPDSVTEIGEKTFRDCTSLTSVTIGNSVTSIGWEAFFKCTSLTSVTIPDSVTSIGDCAFLYCTSLTSVIIGNGVTSIGDCPFADCTSLKEVYCKPTTPPAGKSYMFSNNASGRKIYVPRNSVEAYKSANYWWDYADYIVGYDF